MKKDINKKKNKESKKEAKFFAYRDKKIVQYNKKIEKLKNAENKTTHALSIQHYQNKKNTYIQKRDALQNQKIYSPEFFFSYKVKRLFFGIGKELMRIDWSSYKNVFKSFVIIMIIVVFLACVFMLIDMPVTKYLL